MNIFCNKKKNTDLGCDLMILNFIFKFSKHIHCSYNFKRWYEKKVKSNEIIFIYLKSSISKWQLLFQPVTVMRIYNRDRHCSVCANWMPPCEDTQRFIWNYSETEFSKIHEILFPLFIQKYLLTILFFYCTRIFQCGFVPGVSFISLSFQVALSRL